MYEYKVVPAPRRALKVKGLKTPTDRFAHTLSERLNAETTGGWQFVRTETLPCEVRSGLRGVKSSTETVMIFQRLVAMEPAAEPVATAYEPTYDAPVYAETAEPQHEEYVAQDAQHYAPEPVAEDLPEPVAAPPQSEPPAQPLFRAGAGLRADPTQRAEPVLRPLGGQMRDSDH